MPAVSLRRIRGPRLQAWTLCSCSRVISWGVNPPSGPIQKAMEWGGLGWFWVMICEGDWSARVVWATRPMVSGRF